MAHLKHIEGCTEVCRYSYVRTQGVRSWGVRPQSRRNGHPLGPPLLLHSPRIISQPVSTRFRLNTYSSQCFGGAGRT